MTDSLPCDIVILPAADLAVKAMATSKQLEQFDTLFTLRDGAYFPHASLYMTQLKVSDLDKVKGLLASFAATVPKLNLVATRYDQAEGFIDADYERTVVMARFQMDVINAINPIRDGMREKDKARMLEATGQVRENLEKYGYRGVGDLFRPHLTLTRFRNGEPIDTATLPE